MHVTSVACASRGQPAFNMDSSAALLCALAALLTVIAAETGQELQANREDIRAQPAQDEVEKETPVDYSGTQLWKVDFDHRTALLLIRNLTLSQAISVWGGNHSSLDVMVKPEMIDNVTKIFRSNSIAYNVVIEDLQKLINEENPPLDEEQILLQNRKGHRMTWMQYHRVSDIYGFLDYLAVTYPAHVSLKTVGKSYKGRDIKVLRISNGNPGNKAIWIDGGIHAREWISPATVTYIINQFAENFDEESPEIQNIDWYFMPVVNPDGYEFTHTTNRLWRKNRSGVGPCAGVDLNRNFGYKWGGKGTSSYPCSEIYRGSKAFSEPESKALADFIDNSAADFRAYLSYHSYGQYLLYPWGYDATVPPDHSDLQSLGESMAKAIHQTGGSEYKVGASSILLYPAAGASDDWAKAKGIKYSYTVELSDTGKHGFVLPASYILPVAKESLAGLRVVASRVSKE